MSPETPTQSTKICPTCGTRISESAARCPVCGTEFSQTGEGKAQNVVQGGRMPEITLSLPGALGLLALFLLVGAIMVFFALRATGRLAPPAPDATVTATITVTPTPTDTLIPTPVPSPTDQPPQEYTVGSGDTCISIALTFDVSVQSIILLNNLPVACNTLREGQKLLVPYPTATPAPAATSTLLPAEATLAACDKVTYTVQENDTLSSIALNYNVPQDAIKAYNGLSTDTVYLGLNLVIPLCERPATPGPSPTPTNPPPYPAPNLLLPYDGAPFTLADNAVTLQWSSVGTLRDNERYQVTIEDLTSGNGAKDVELVSDTKYIIPSSVRPTDNLPHIFRWTVSTVRQGPPDSEGNATWDTAGAESLSRVFSWIAETISGTPSP
jgi:LysM repeat protein